MSSLGSVDSPPVDIGVNIVDRLLSEDAAIVYQMCKFSPDGFVISNKTFWPCSYMESTCNCMPAIPPRSLANRQRSQRQARQALSAISTSFTCIQKSRMLFDSIKS